MAPRQPTAGKPDTDDVEIATAMALALLGALNGNPVGRDGECALSSALAGSGVDPTRMLTRLVLIGALETREGSIYLGPLGKAIVACWAVTA